LYGLFLVRQSRLSELTGRMRVGMWVQVSDRSGSAAAWQHLSLPASGPPLLFAAGADGSVSLFDLRANAGEAAARIRLNEGPLVRRRAPVSWR